MTKVLILSAHSFSLDRRIIAQANSLSKKAHDVILMSVPVIDDFSDILNKKVKKIIPVNANRTPSAKKKILALLKAILKKILPGFLFEQVILLRHIQHYSKIEKNFIEKAKKLDFDIIHAHDLPILKAAIKLKKLKKNVKLIYDSHEIYPHQFKNQKLTQYLSSLEKRLITAVDEIIVVNESIKKHFETVYKPICPISVLYNSYGFTLKSNDSLSKNSLSKTYGWDPTLPIFIFQGGISEERNLLSLIAAFEKLNNAANLIIVGEGNAKKRLVELKQERKIRNVAILDWVQQADLPQLINSADFGVIPYMHNGLLNNLYCTPNKLFEYIALNKPILASPLPEVSKIIDSYQIGITHDLSTEENFLNALQTFLAKKDELKKRDFANAQNAYGWKKQEDTLFNLYDKISRKHDKKRHKYA